MNNLNSFESLYEEMYKSLIKLAEKKLVNRSNAEDIVQDVFTKSLEYLQAKPEQRLSKYILKRNVIIGCVKDNKRGGQK